MLKPNNSTPTQVRSAIKEADMRYCGLEWCTWKEKYSGEHWTSFKTSSFKKV